MDRKKDAMGFGGAGFLVTRVVPASVLLGLMVLLAVLFGCQRQLSTSREMSQGIRPARQISRLVQNAEYLRKSGRLELAVEELEEARLQKPDNLEILDLLAHCYEELGHFERAQELYEQALSQAGHHPGLENNRCYSLYLQGRLNQAESCFRQVLKREPDNQTARNNLGLVLCSQGREADAMALWQETLSETEARQIMGQALASLGREAPPNLAGLAATPAEQQTAAASKSAATSVPEPSEPRTYLYSKQESSSSPQTQSAASPPRNTASPDQNLTTAPSVDQSPTERPQQLAAQVPASATAAPGDQPVEKGSQQKPEPTATLRPDIPTQPQTKVAATEAGKEPSPAPAGTATIEKSTDNSPPILTALNLRETGIELRNGNGVHDCARDFRSRLSREGFNVVAIGNHIDFGLEETLIAYKSEAAPVAKVLAQKFFPRAKLEAGGNTSPGADIRVSLGHDLKGGQEPTSQSPEKVAVVEPAPPPPAAVPVTQAPPEKAAPAEAPPLSPAVASDVPHSFVAQTPPQMRIELRNGNGVPGQAREMGKLLRFEGFKVVNIGNHSDFDLKETVIAYRPEAAEAAEVLSQKFFSGANLEEKDNLPFWMDIRVLLGQDLNPDQGPLAQMTH